MDTNHLYRSALNERKSSDGYFGPLSEMTPEEAEVQRKNAQAPAQNAQQAPPAPNTVQQQNPAQNNATVPPRGATAPQPPAPAQQPAAGSPQKPPVAMPGNANQQNSTVSQMSVSAQKTTQLAPGISLPAGTPATITPGDLNGNVNVQVGDKSYKIPDANLKQLIKSGAVQAQAESKSARLLRIMSQNGV